MHPLDERRNTSTGVHRIFCNTPRATRTRSRIDELTYRINVDTLHREPADTLTLNEMGRVRIRITQPLFFDPYQVNRATRGF